MQISWSRPADGPDSWPNRTSRCLHSHTATSAATAAAAAATRANAGGELTECLWHILPGLSEDSYQRLCVLGVIGAHQRDCSATRASTSGAADAMDVVLSVVWEVVILPATRAAHAGRGM